jgi:cellulose synthase/poly-beta-1,6-N-acetylglucosamine synthase-like glycosyltransferase
MRVRRRRWECLGADGLFVVMREKKIDYEIIFVDDNSNDGTVEIVDELFEKDKIPVR